MIFQRAAALALVCLGTTACARADKAAEELTIATWSLEWFFDDALENNRSEIAKEQSAPNAEEWQWKRHIMAEAMAKYQPTILAVQEIEDRLIMATFEFRKSP